MGDARLRLALHQGALPLGTPPGGRAPWTSDRSLIIAFFSKYDNLVE